MRYVEDTNFPGINLDDLIEYPKKNFKVLITKVNTRLFVFSMLS